MASPKKKAGNRASPTAVITQSPKTTDLTIRMQFKGIAATDKARLERDITEVVVSVLGVDNIACGAALNYINTPKLRNLVADPPTE